MSTTRKIYIDSRQGQGTGSDFTLTLKQSVQCPENTVAFIDEIIVPNTFLTVEQNRCYIYIRKEFKRSSQRGASSWTSGTMLAQT